MTWGETESTQIRFHGQRDSKVVVVVTSTSIELFDGAFGLRKTQQIQACNKTKISLIFRNERFVVNNRSRRNQSVCNQQAMTQEILLQQFNRTVGNFVCNFQNPVTTEKLFKGL